VAEDQVVMRRDLLMLLTSIDTGGEDAGDTADAVIAAGWRPTTACRCGCGQRWVSGPPEGHPPERRRGRV
jgi:hypothetical protein